MVVVGITALLVLASFSFVLIFGPPYLPTLGKQVEIALDMADLKPGQTLLELGCGDGKVLVAAARRGYRAVGYELNPLLVLLCRLRTYKYRKTVSVRWANFLTHAWPPSDAIFVFGLDRIMPKLDKKVMQSKHKPVKLVSFAFEIPGRTVKQKREGLYLYEY